MATAHAQLIADLNDKGVTNALSRMGSGMEAFALKAVRNFQTAETEAEKYSRQLDKVIAKELSLVAASNQVAQVEAKIASQRAQRRGAGPDLAFEDRMADMQRAQGSGRQSAGGASKGSYRAGQAALQAQDIAVQLEMGTNAGRVLIQQGTQLASIFGPTGAIIAGVSAIAAVIGGWVLGINKVIEAEKRLLKESKSRLEQTKDLAGGSISAVEDAKKFERQRLFGDEEADRMARQEAHEKRIAHIQSSTRSKGSIHEELEIKRFKEQERLIEHRKQAAIAEATAREKEDMRSLEKRNAGIRADINGESPDQKMMRLAAEYGKLAEAQQKLGGMDWLKKENEMLEVQSELTKAAREETEKYQKSVQTYAKSMEGAFESAAKAARTVRDSISEIAKDFQKKIGEELANNAAKAMANTIAKGQAIINRARDLMDPQAAREKKREKRQEDRAIREIAERDANAIDTKRRNNRRDPMSPRERRAFIAGEVGKANAARDRNDQTKIDPADITKLAEAIAKENAKLLTK